MSTDVDVNGDRTEDKVIEVTEEDDVTEDGEDQGDGFPARPLEVVGSPKTTLGDVTAQLPQMKAYLGSKENALLVPNKNFGNRKYFSFHMNFGKKNASSGSHKWVHPPEALLRGHIVYTVKFLGHVEVDQPKGTEVVKEAIRKMKFNKQIRKAEGQKPPKVELTVSVDGVTIQNPKQKIIEHKYPLHRISYCADDKSDKRMFTFIAKHHSSNKHDCFVFDSEKCAEEITLTVGQAFDLAYKKFLESSSRDMDMKKQYLLLQKKVQALTQENLELKARVADLERLVDPIVLGEFDKQRQNGHTPVNSSLYAAISTKKNFTNGTAGEQPVVGRKLENLLMDEDSAAVTNGNAPALAPPPPVPTRSRDVPTSPVQSQGQVDLFGAVPFSDASPPPNQSGNPFTGSPGNPFGGGSKDAFGMDSFDGGNIDDQLKRVDAELLDLQTGFSQGLSIGREDFNLEDLDPLHAKK